MTKSSFEAEHYIDGESVKNKERFFGLVTVWGNNYSYGLPGLAKRNEIERHWARGRSS